MFYLGFLAGAVPASLLAQRYPVERVLFAIVFLWGGCLMTTAACDTWRALYVQRFFLGLLEAGVSPMFMLAVGSFYTKGEQAVRQGVWYSSSKWKYPHNLTTKLMFPTSWVRLNLLPAH
jgi:MFS family permease